MNLPMLRVGKFGIARRIATMTITVFYGHDTFLYRSCQTSSRGTKVMTKPRRSPRMIPLLSDPWV